MKFTDLELHEDILKGIEEAGFTDCTPVQEQVFQTVAEGKDVFAQSQTGTGKTAAFLISIYQTLMTDKSFKGRKALVIVPTRELAVQIEQEAAILGSALDFRVGSFYGGVGYNEQEKLLEGGCDILVGTPGRLIDFSKSGKIHFSEVGILVIDEADRLFDMGFLPDLRKILDKTPPAKERRTMLFSATLNNKVGNLAWEYMNSPGEIVIEPEQVTVETISQELYHVSADEKMSLLLGILQRDKPETGIIFANTKYTTYEVAERMKHNGYNAKCLMGDLLQKKRLRIIEEVKEGKVPFLVATDVAARGLHIDNLAMVINYDIPTDAESYVHRIGRTARAGRSGKAVTLACEKFVYGLSAIENLTGQKIPVLWAEENLLVEDKSAGMRFYFDRDPSSRHNHSKGQRSRHFGNKRPLNVRASKVQSAVLNVSGTEGYMGKSPRGDQSSQSWGRRNTPRPRREAVHKSHPPKGNTSMEDRLVHYKKKYGEDFTEKASLSSRGPKPSPEKMAPSPQGAQRSSPKQVSQGSPQSQRQDSNRPSTSRSLKKRGILFRLFRG